MKKTAHAGLFNTIYCMQFKQQWFDTDNLIDCADNQIWRKTHKRMSNCLRKVK
jgi:hypothetical protein